MMGFVQVSETVPYCQPRSEREEQKTNECRESRCRSSMSDHLHHRSQRDVPSTRCRCELE